MFGEPEYNQLFLVIPGYARSLLPAHDPLMPWVELRVGDEYVFFFADTSKAKPFHKALLDQAIPFNKALFADPDSFWPTLSQAVRYDSDGTRKVSNAVKEWSADLSDAYMRLLNPYIKNLTQLQRTVMSLLMDTNWHEQERNATLHRTRKLLGDPDCGA